MDALEQTPCGSCMIVSFENFMYGGSPRFGPLALVILREDVNCWLSHTSRDIACQVIHGRWLCWYREIFNACLLQRLLN